MAVRDLPKGTIEQWTVYTNVPTFASLDIHSAAEKAVVEIWRINLPSLLCRAVGRLKLPA